MFVPLFSNGTVNLGVIGTYANYAHASGPDTVILGGSTGEWPKLTVEERVQALRWWCGARR